MEILGPLSTFLKISFKFFKLNFSRVKQPNAGYHITSLVQAKLILNEHSGTSSSSMFFKSSLVLIRSIGESACKLFFHQTYFPDRSNSNQLLLTPFDSEKCAPPPPYCWQPVISRSFLKQAAETLPVPCYSDHKFNSANNSCCTVLNCLGPAERTTNT